ncbi:acetyl-CoA carboxylase biotin carboxyl carrier protein [Halomonas sp.]|uniref:acetyl-CoA carboxylase biotin carboxyl carrier protein n=1 Tax=Halomonas sp. TaxID=1486246 RepID=UPI003A9482F5
MKHEELMAILDGFHQSDLISLEVTRGGNVLKLKRASTLESSHLPIEATSDSAEKISAHDYQVSEGAQPTEALITSPIHGIFHASEKPGASPLVTQGDQVKSGQTLGILEAMKMFHNLCATKDGVIKEIFCVDGEEVEVDKPLFRII